MVMPLSLQGGPEGYSYKVYCSDVDHIIASHKIVTWLIRRRPSTIHHIVLLILYGIKPHAKHGKSAKM